MKINIGRQDSISFLRLYYVMIILSVLRSKKYYKLQALYYRSYVSYIMHEFYIIVKCQSHHTFRTHMYKVSPMNNDAISSSELGAQSRQGYQTLI